MAPPPVAGVNWAPLTVMAGLVLALVASLGFAKATVETTTTATAGTPTYGGTLTQLHLFNMTSNEPPDWDPVKAAGPQGWRKDVENFAAVRQAVGSKIMIGVDPNTGWSWTDAISAMNAMRPMGLGYMEQPIDRHDLAGLAEIRARADGIPIMADESLLSLADAYRLAREGLVGMFNVKVVKVGGIMNVKAR